MTTFRALLLCGLLAAPMALSAQEPRNGRIVGKVLDEAGNPVPGAQVGIALSSTSTTAGVDGRYTLLNVVPGAVALSVRAIGYSPKTVSGVVVPSGGVVNQDIVLTTQTMEVEGISVTSEAERGSVSAALDRQRTSDQVTNAVTAEDIARSPDSDAGQAVQRVSGVTVQDGRYVFVRGLGERYTTTSLNNSRLPSPEPERRVVPLDLFPSNLLESITTTKTFTPDQPGDFSGAQVDLRTREFPLRRSLTLSASSGLNSAATGRNLQMAPRTGREWLGYASHERDLPPNASGDLSNLSLPEAQAIIGSLRNAWSISARDGAPQGGFGISLGGEDPVWGQPVGYIASFGYSSSTDVRSDEERAVATPGATPGSTVPINSYSGATAAQSVIWGGLLNLTTRLGGSTKLSFNNTFSRSADNAATVLRGINEEFATEFEITRLGFVSRDMRAHQLQGQHLFGLSHLIEWSAALASVKRSEPDRSDLIYDLSGAAPRWFGNGRSAVRSFADVTESSTDFSGSYRLDLGGRRAIKVGASHRTVDRDADGRSFAITNLNLSSAERTAPPESIFARPDDLFLQPDVLVGSYHADDQVTAGFAMLELPLGARLRMIGGARIERWALDLTTFYLQLGRDSTLQRRNTDLLPSLALTWAMTANQNVRLSASQTLSRPEYREIAFTTTRDIAGGVDQQGNENLQRALVRNFDLRWEWYPRPGEALSVGLFAKTFTDPIERVVIQSASTPTTSWANAKGAENFGVELEFRRSLDIVAPRLLPFWVGFNATLMHSRVRVDTLTSATTSDRAMVGQAGYVVNTALGWSPRNGRLSVTLLHNVVGRRVYEAGIRGQPDAVELPRHMLDLSLRSSLTQVLSLKLDFKNLLDAPYEIVQGQVTRHKYRTGRQASFGLSWQP